MRWNRLVNVVWEKSLNKGVILLLQDPADLEQSQIAAGENLLSVLLKPKPDLDKIRLLCISGWIFPTILRGWGASLAARL